MKTAKEVREARANREAEVEQNRINVIVQQIQDKGHFQVYSHYFYNDAYLDCSGYDHTTDFKFLNNPKILQQFRDAGYKVTLDTTILTNSIERYRNKIDTSWLSWFRGARFCVVRYFEELEQEVAVIRIEACCGEET